MECAMKNVPAGFADTVVDRPNAALAQPITSIGSVKAVEIGD